MEPAAGMAEPVGPLLMPGSQLVLFGRTGLAILAAVLALSLWMGRPLLVLFCALLLLAGGLAWVWTALSQLGLRCVCSLSASRGFPGDRVRLSVTLDNGKPLPLGVHAEIAVPGELAPGTVRGGSRWPGYAGFSAALGWFERVTWHCDLLCRRRGYYNLGPARWLSGDGFGLYLDERSRPQQLPLVVYPRLYELEDLGLPSRHPLGEARDPSLLFEDASRPRGLRDYTADTPFKKIAWGASARTGRLQAKVFEPTASVQVTLFLAVDRFAPGGDGALFELGVSTAASLAYGLIGERQPVGLLCNGVLSLAEGARPQVSEAPMVLGAGRGEGHIESILANLAGVTRQTLTPFDALLKACAGMLSGGTTLCVIAEHLDADDLVRLAALRRHGCGIMALIVGEGPLPDGIACRRVAAANLNVLRA
jgi:uncharacterized protein (DUF58 family)